jgi:cobalamin biosynthesis protein CobT
MVAKYAGFVVHELLHRKYTDFNATASIDYVRALHNACEDAWIENSAIASGLLGNIGGLLGGLVDGMVNEALTQVSDWDDAKQYPFILAVHARAHGSVKCPTNANLAPIFDTATKAIAACKNSADTLRVAEWVYEQISKQSQQDPQKSKGKGKDGNKGDNKDNAPAKDENGPSSPSNDEGKGDPAKQDKAPSEAPLKSPNGVDPAEVEPTLNPAKGDVQQGTFSKQQDMKSRNKVLNYCEDHNVGSAPVPARLKFEVKRLFDDSGLTEFTRNRKAGSVNVHALPSVATGNDRVFKRRLDVEGIDSSVVICLDVSGSMWDNYGCTGYDKLVPALQTLQAMLETLSAAGVPTAVLTFGSEVAVFKDWNVNHKRILPDLRHIGSGGGTNDYFAIKVAHEMLLGRHEQRRIAFVITDGDGNRSGVRQQIASGTALGLTTIGIGIQHDVSSVYPQSVNVRNMADLASTSFKQIKLAA